MIVTQEWTHDLSIMKQTTLLTALRAPDGVEKYHPVKNLLRWYRRCILVSAFDGKVLKTPWEKGGGSFTGPSVEYRQVRGVDGFVCVNNMKDLDEVTGAFIQNLDRLPWHFITHMMHGAQILGADHPDEEIAYFWLMLYSKLCNELHVHPETHNELNKRLSDNRDEWLKRNNPETTA